MYWSSSRLPCPSHGLVWHLFGQERLLPKKEFHGVNCITIGVFGSLCSTYLSEKSGFISLIATLQSTSQDLCSSFLPQYPPRPDLPAQPAKAYWPPYSNSFSWYEMIVESIFDMHRHCMIYPYIACISL